MLSKPIALATTTAMMWYRRADQNPPRFVRSKRFVTLILVFSGLFTMLFFRATQILHYRIELSRVRFQHRACEEKVKAITKFSPTKSMKNNYNNITISAKTLAVQSLLKNMSGMRTATGFDDLTPVSPSVFILPHLKKDPHRLLPLYHMKGDRVYADIVIGITHVKRAKGSYLIGTLKDLVIGISNAEMNSTLIIILVGESDLKYVLNTTWTIEKVFPEQVKNGLIEVISPSESYYPDLDSLPPTLGDSPKRVKWRTKEVLDVSFLMAYGHTKGSYYLMMEDDVSATQSYMKDVKTYTLLCTAKEPEWVLIEFSHYFGSLGKLFKSSEVGHFLTFLQLFYRNMPLDFLIESYLRDRVCDLTRNSNDCYDAIAKIRKVIPAPMFKHIGLYSSLPGKIGKVQDLNFAKGRKFFPHTNPLLKYIRSDIKEMPFHTLKMAYEGSSMFLGVNPKSGDVIEFWFAKPTALKSYKFQSGNFQRKYDIFIRTDVEVYPVSLGNFTKVGSFDELGYAEGDLEDFGPLEGIRLKVINFDWDITKNVVLSEIELVRLASPVTKCS